MRNRSGYSLIEIMISAVLLALVIYAGQSLLFSSQKTTNESFKRHSFRAELQTIGGMLQKFMSGSDLRFYAFSGLGTTDRILARMLLPLPGRCRDLSTSGCEDQTSFMYVHYDKSISPAVSIVCVTDSGLTWLIDTNNSSYGSSTFADGVFQVNGGANNISGAIKLTPGTTIALMDPPTATLWVATAAPEAVQYTQVSDGTITPALPAECNKALLQPNGTGTGGVQLHQLGGLVRVTVTPLSLNQFTGGAGASASDRESVFGTLPLRMFVTSLRTVGPLPITATNNFEFGISQCQVSGGTASCPSSILTGPGGVNATRVEESFAVAMGNSGASAYQILKSSGTRTGSCQNPGCKVMTLPEFPVPGVKVSATNGAETIESLDETTFSFMKQDILKRIRFKLILDNAKEESIDALFP